MVGVLERMGAAITFDTTSGTLSVRASRLRAVELTAVDIPGIVDEVPVLAMAATVAGACAAEGTTVIEGWDSVATSYPRFTEDRVRLTGAGAEPVA
ncbi:hypothetical protein [Streptomyces sp. NPDC029554]|uniref:hypothetical protein n=1 Tax=Streptomyces sp. NPDC029554 TaxID=3155126 RepID=UPI0033C2BAD1